MNTTKSVYNRLFQEDKVELASERVELAVIDDFKKYISDSKEMSNAYNDLKKRIADLESQRADVIKRKEGLASFISRSSNNVIKALTDFEKRAKELGFNASENPLYVETDKLFNENTDVLGKLDSLIK